MIGLALGRRWHNFPEIQCFPLGLLFILANKKRGWWLFVSVCALSLGLGWWRAADFRIQILPYETLYRQDVRVELTAKTDGVYAKSGSLSFDGGSIKFIEPRSVALPGTLAIETRGITAVYRGDQLEVRGRLYPAGGSRQGSIRYATATLLDRPLGWIDRMRLNFSAGTQTALPEPQASLGLGILVGQRSTLPEEVSDQLSTVGLTHIIAVSGYNLTIIVRFIGKKFGRSKYQTLLLSIVLIAIFILITGFSASIVRAGVVSGLSLGAWYYGRTIKPLTILLLSGAITAGWYPIYIWSDIGWYLSFLAFYGVLMLGPLISKYFWKEGEPGGLTALVIESGCAQIMTAPLIMYIFGQTSLVALPSNMIIVPLIPLAMLAAFTAGLAGMRWVSVAGWLAWPARILLGFITETVSLLASVPNALMQWSISLVSMLGCYLLLTGITWLLWHKTRTRYGKITDERSRY